MIYCVLSRNLIRSNLLELRIGILIGYILTCIGARIDIDNACTDSGTKYDADKRGRYFRSVEDIGMVPPTDRDNNDTLSDVYMVEDSYGKGCKWCWY